VNVLGKAILVGNGINRVAGLTPTWSEIVSDLLDHENPDRLEKRMAVTPWPLLVEEAIGLQQRMHAERVVRDLVDKLSEWKPTAWHRKLVALNVEHILTTNYDLVLENSFDGEPIRPEKPFQRETRYSMFRRNILPNGTRVWHIHGSIQNPNTMVLRVRTLRRLSPCHQTSYGRR
jgi:hypothetical protein